jgi:hypothetical protein
MVDTAHSIDYDKLRDRFTVEYEAEVMCMSSVSSRRTNTYVCDMHGATAIFYYAQREDGARNWRLLTP